MLTSKDNPSAAPPLTFRDSPSSKPPPDKRISNKQMVPQATPASTSTLTKLKLVVSEASVLPPPPTPQSNEPQRLPQPISSQSSSRESLAQTTTMQPSSSKQLPQEPKMGFQGTPHSQKTVEGIMGDFSDVKVKNSGPTGTPLRKQAIQNPSRELLLNSLNSLHT